MIATEDTDFRDVLIEKAERDGEGWSLTFDDGWSFGVGAECPVEPKPGMRVRLFGKGIGYRVRGITIDGQVVYYRTAAEDEDHGANEMYGATAADLLAKWDRGATCHTIEMGGMGPGYEQAIQITMFEILRHLLAAKYDAALWEDADVWKADREATDAAVSPIIKGLGLSGAQWGAAFSLAIQFYRRGPREVMADAAVMDRHTMVNKSFPSLATASAE
jgi:hypothetical protein